jgi:ribosomal protein L37AE/L43A
MENLLQDNKNCADCDSENVTNANMDKGITLCAECAKAHQRILKIPCRNLDELNEEEISYINKQGNVKSNSALMKNVMQWTISLKYNNNQ